MEPDVGSADVARRRTTYSPVKASIGALWNDVDVRTARQGTPSVPFG
ncbi:MAG: hypothetical protein ABSA07_09065 [Acidimicrobiales bacterium]